MTLTYTAYDWPDTRRTSSLRLRLSPREVEVLEYVASGGLNKQIADRLGISKETVKNHLSSIMAKLNANNRTQAVLIAMKSGIVSVERALELAEDPDGLHRLIMRPG